MPACPEPWAPVFILPLLSSSNSGILANEFPNLCFDAKVLAESVFRLGIASFLVYLNLLMMAGFFAYLIVSLISS